MDLKVTQGTKEKVLLVVVEIKRTNDWSIEEVTHEMEELVIACQGEVVERLVCRIDRPSPGHLIGDGKVKELTDMCQLKNVNTVVFSHDLKGSQQRNLEEATGVKTIDRTQLILDIFAHRATSLEGKMQVELAQLEYLRPRLVGQGIALSRLGGGIGTLGPGETKLEVDRRRIDQRISKLQKDLDDIVADRILKRKKRQERGIPVISLVGYTNAGKSTLLNLLTQAEQQTREGLFTTLDSLSRQLILPNHQKVILSDTVGFMHDLPHHLIEAFKATLEEVVDADLLVHVIDISQPNSDKRSEAVFQVLKQLGVESKPVITVLNKIDRLSQGSSLEELRQTFPDSVAISAKTGENISGLIERILAQLKALFTEVEILLPINRMDLVHLAHKEGQVYSVKYYNDSIHLRAALPNHLVGKFQKAAFPQK